MIMKLGFTGRVARASAARPWLIIVAWIIGLVAALAAAGSLGDALVQDDKALIETESGTANDLDEALRGDAAEVVTETIIVESDTFTFPDSSFLAAIEATRTTIASLEGIESVEVPTVANSAPVSADQSTALLTATLSLDHPEDLGTALNDATAGMDLEGFSVYTYGEDSAYAAFDKLGTESLVRGELIGIGAAIVILLVVFGALMAAGLPLMVALVSIVSAVGATAIVGRAFDLSFFILNMITMMGLALGIDYSLVIVQRFREELAHGRSVTDAVAIAGNTASRAVLISGITVLISLAGLLVVPSTIMVSLGSGAMIVAVFSVISALTLLPAVLRLLGQRVNKGSLPISHPGAEPRAWSALARGVLKRPAVAAVAGLGVLAALALPALSMRLTFPGTDALPDHVPFKQATEVLTEDFGFGQASSLIVIDDAGNARAEVEALASAVEASEAFAETSLSWEGDVAFIETKDVYDSADIKAEQAVKDLRSETIPEYLEGTGARAYVTGEQADTIDFTKLITDAAPWVALIVLGASLIMLLVTFRSVTIAGTAIVLNVLSTAAAYGVLVAVFQFGWAADALGMPVVGGIAPWIPLFLFAVLFGLSMDYHVFLLSRIKERHSATGDTRDAIAFGLSRTGSLITGAALIMVAVFAGFAIGDLAEFNQMGLGLAVAVILDATVVRSLLVPAVMALLGDANWYLPRWLQWLPQLQVEGDSTQYLDREPDVALVPARVR
ncbi:MMPL family transporter [Demequina sp. TTPB684]|uniref:MMPL family transporter n=1 Tax=unclassified Demequina TaxID=2620311 RepID=UPI001CF2BE0C|nr:MULTISPECIES: MMPL family transporter [unclassified Demequina]MCB2412271.1 MMPL family transporter [Demequina sp. TTPB684]UPU88471.1 MMPL family transporter [Demequina sp. TMPB413]